MIKLAIITTVIGGSLIAGSWYISADTQPQALTSATNKAEQINNYNDCVAAGYPVMESLPEQCATADGRTFTNTPAQLPPNNGIAVGEPYGETAPQADDVTAATEAVRAIAAKDLATAGRAFDVTTVAAADWPNSCLGLPEEDEMCAMMITPGYKITLTIDGNTATYRTNQNGTVVRRVLE